MKLSDSRIRYVVYILMGISAAFFSLQQMTFPSMTEVYAVITAAVSCLTGIFLSSRYYNDIQSVINNKRAAIVILAVSACFVYGEYIQKGSAYYLLLHVLHVETGMPDFWVDALNFFNIRYYIISLPFVFFLFTITYNFLRELIKNIFEGIDLKERRMYLVISCVMMGIVFIVYMAEPYWYLQFDNVYSIDSGWCYEIIYPELSYYDIRHPLLSELTFPIWSVIICVLKVFAPSNLIPDLTGILIQWTNISMLVLIGIMLRKLTGEIAVFFMYICSFPTILFTISLEKFQLCVFLLLLYVYCKCMKRKEASELIILSTGVMPTNAFMSLLELSDECSLKDKIKNICKIVVMGVLSFIVLGRIHLLNIVTAYQEIHSMHASFGLGTLTFTQKLNSVLNMIQSSFVALSSAAGGNYLWQSVTEKVTVLSVIIVAVMFIGIVTGMKTRFYRICSLWTLFAFILFIGLSWAVHESPLFAIIFSWSMIALFHKGMIYFIGKWNLKKKYVYGSILSVMLFVNVSAIIDIWKYLSSLQ